MTTPRQTRDTLEAFIDRSKAHLITVEVENRILHLPRRNSAEQVTYRADAKAALDKLMPYYQRRSEDAQFDALSWLNENEDIVRLALDYAEVFGRPIAYDGRINDENPA